MKKFIVLSLIVQFLSCADSETKISGPSATAQIVIESFYQGGEAMIKEYTTEEGYANFKNLMAMFAKSKNTDSNFKVIEENVEDEVAWVKYTTSYVKTPGIFKLVKDVGAWKVTARKPGEKVWF